MKPFWVGRFPRGWFWMLIIIGAVPISLSQSLAPRPIRDAAVPVCGPRCENQPAALSTAERIEYLGVYSPDGKFRTTARTDRDNLRGRASSSNFSPGWSRPSEVPASVNLHPRERVEENYEPPAHAMKPAKGQSLLASLRDNIVTFVYGRERVLLAPHHVTVDSRGRILIVDPDARAVHVLGDGDSFRIAGGPQRRLRLPNGIAMDAADNIYVADSERALVLVYAPEGKFLRYIGKRGDETLFHYPTAIAIDRNRGRLFVLDSPRHLMFVLDLEGNVLQRIGRLGHAIGRFSGDSIPLDLDYPTEIAIGNNELVVVDSGNSRVRVLDLRYQPVAQFSIPATPGPPMVDEVGLGVDVAGNIYVSATRDSQIRIYSRLGSLLSSFGHAGTEIGEFNSPAGLWIDGTNRLYVADTNNSRVQVFQLRRDPATATEAERARVSALPPPANNLERSK
jgi:DNA-binding beta-propeller fold protein YncE